MRLQVIAIIAHQRPFFDGEQQVTTGPERLNQQSHYVRQITKIIQRVGGDDQIERFAESLEVFDKIGLDQSIVSACLLSVLEHLVRQVHALEVLGEWPQEPPDQSNSKWTSR